MDALRRLAPRGPLAPRRLLLALLAVTAILVGLLAMHTLSGGGHAAHEAGIAQSAAHDDRAAPAAAAAHGDHAGRATPAAAPAEPAGLLAELSMGRADAVGELAQRMLDDQTAEIAEMRQLLTEL